MSTLFQKNPSSSNPLDQDSINIHFSRNKLLVKNLVNLFSFCIPILFFSFVLILIPYFFEKSSHIYDTYTSDVNKIISGALFIFMSAISYIRLGGMKKMYPNSLFTISIAISVIFFTTLAFAILFITTKANIIDGVLEITLGAVELVAVLSIGSFLSYKNKSFFPMYFKSNIYITVLIVIFTTNVLFISLYYKNIELDWFYLKNVGMWFLAIFILLDFATMFFLFFKFISSKKYEKKSIWSHIILSKEMYTMILAVSAIIVGAYHLKFANTWVSYLGLILPIVIGIFGVFVNWVLIPKLNVVIIETLIHYFIYSLIIIVGLIFSSINQQLFNGPSIYSFSSSGGLEGTFVLSSGIGLLVTSFVCNFIPRSTPKKVSLVHALVSLGSLLPLGALYVLKIIGIEVIASKLLAMNIDILVLVLLFLSYVAVMFQSTIIYSRANSNARKLMKIEIKKKEREKNKSSENKQEVLVETLKGAN